jgi:prevent-host-death family protein
MGKSVAISAARAKLAALVREAGRGKRIQITQDGRPTAVLVSVEDAQRIDQSTGYWRWLEEHADVDLSSLETPEERAWAKAAERNTRKRQ